MKNYKYTVDLVIPSYKPDEKFDHLLRRLAKQTIKLNHIFIINTEEQYLNSSQYVKIPNLSIINIKKEEFDHGGTRNYGAGLSNSEIIMFMTQDAVPAGRHLIEYLLKPFSDERIAAVYGRQLPAKDSGVIEKYTRRFNYPAVDFVKFQKDRERLGIKTYFCSNVCAAYRKKVYTELGGFAAKTIFNEDMILASKVITAGYGIAYASKAGVIHSHKYTYLQQFTRNFDLAVSQRQYKEAFVGIKSENEGIKLVGQTMKHLIRIHKFHLIPDLMMQSGFKYLGFKAGSIYEHLPKRLVKMCSMNKSYWKEG